MYIYIVKGFPAPRKLTNTSIIAHIYFLKKFFTIGPCWLSILNITVCKCEPNEVGSLQLL